MLLWPFECFENAKMQKDIKKTLPLHPEAKVSIIILLSMDAAMIPRLPQHYGEDS